MSPELRLRRLDALSALMKRFLEPREERLGDALDTLLDATPASAAAAFDRETNAAPLASRRLPQAHQPHAEAIARAFGAIAARVLATSSQVLLSDVERDTLDIEGVRALLGIGARAALAIPLYGDGSVDGAVVLAFADSAMLDEETLRYIEAVTRLSALVSERDRVDEAEARFRDELAETGRMATLGLYTTSVAHELRGPTGALVLQHEELRSISHQLGILAGPCDPAIGSGVSDLSELVADMGVAIQRIRDTVSQLTTLGRRETNHDLVPLAEVVRESLTIARPHLERRGIVLGEELDPDCFTRGRRDNLGQVVLNLVLNAADATEGVVAPRVWVKVNGEPGQVVLSVEDNGPGVAEAAIAEIFKPFFTTKQRGQGTGLGLKICSDVVSSHGGHIEVDQRPGGGARFRVVLPRMISGAHTTTTTRAVPQPPLEETPLLPPVQHRVLVIDDDPIFSRTLKRALRPHDVRSTASASEAEIALLDPGYEPDLVLCDVLLPGANGNVLHARVAERRPDVAARFVFVTGGGLAKAEADYLRGTGCLTLFKPIDTKVLLDLLQLGPDSTGTVRTLSLSEFPSAAKG